MDPQTLWPRWVALTFGALLSASVALTAGRSFAQTPMGYDLAERHFGRTSFLENTCSSEGRIREASFFMRSGFPQVDERSQSLLVVSDGTQRYQTTIRMSNRFAELSCAFGPGLLQLRLRATGNPGGDQPRDDVHLLFNLRDGRIELVRRTVIRSDDGGIGTQEWDAASQTLRETFLPRAPPQLSGCIREPDVTTLRWTGAIFEEVSTHHGGC